MTIIFYGFYGLLVGHFVILNVLQLTVLLWQVGRAGKRFVSAWARIQSFCILFLSYYFKSQIKRFGGLGKHAQANGFKA
jgi:hypothetical protein